MDVIAAVQFIQLFFAGILAGVEIVIHFGLRGPSEVLKDQAQLQLRPALVLRLRVLVPAFFIPTAASAVAITVLDGTAPGLWLRGGGLLALVVWIAVRVVGTVPINSATLRSDLAAPPNDWKAQIVRAERFHDLGVWAVILLPRGHDPGSGIWPVKIELRRQVPSG
jgi:hypothetical protein